MYRIYAVLLMLVIASIACGDIPPTSQITTTATNTQVATSTVTEVPSVFIAGCWNIRSGPGVEYEVVRVSCDEFESVSDHAHGWAYVGDGWLCVQAIGFDEKCDP